jgi:hypothetical protein
MDLGKPTNGSPKKKAAKKTARKSAPGAALKKYQLAMKKGTTALNNQLKAAEKKIAALKKAKKAKIKLLTKKYKK